MGAVAAGAAAMIAQGGSSVRGTRRLLVRRDGALAPGAWRGWLPGLALAGLLAFAAGPFARQVIEGSVRDHVTRRLQQDGFGWVDVTVSGQQVVLSGTPATVDDGLRAVQAARAAECPTWLGPMTCAVLVVPAFAPPQPALAAPPSAQPGSASSDAAASAPAGRQAVPPPPLDEAACSRDLSAAIGGARIEFRSARAQLEEAGSPLLDRLADVMARCQGRFRIEGHTDDTGSPDRNLALSRARADTVRSALVQRGVDPARLEIAGFGATRPVTTDTGDDARARNRRIEIRLIPAR